MVSLPEGWTLEITDSDMGPWHTCTLRGPHGEEHGLRITRMQMMDGDEQYLGDMTQKWVNDMTGDKRVTTSTP